MSVPEELRRVAYHEAGHAVAAYRLGRTAGPVTIAPTKGYDGLCIHGRLRVPKRDRGKMLRPLPLEPAGLRRSIETTVVIALAGPAAERLGPPRSGYVAPAPDETAAVQLLESFVAPTSKEQESLDAAGARVHVEAEHSDEAIAYRYAEALAWEPGVTPAYLEFLRAVAVDLISSPSSIRLIERLVPRLIEHKTLSARSVRALLKGETNGTSQQDEKA